VAPRKARLDEQFDADRFGVWIEVLVEAAPIPAAEKLSQMPIEQLIAGLRPLHARVRSPGDRDLRDDRRRAGRIGEILKSNRTVSRT
jgi:hypothetical protein